MTPVEEVAELLKGEDVESWLSRELPPSLIRLVPTRSRVALERLLSGVLDGTVSLHHAGIQDGLLGAAVATTPLEKETALSRVSALLPGARGTPEDTLTALSSVVREMLDEVRREPSDSDAATKADDALAALSVLMRFVAQHFLPIPVDLEQALWDSDNPNSKEQLLRHLRN